ncbi:Predicted enzyme of the cupin superfamily [Sphingopyxis sp. YR583]|uniref:cupin domain-containing protein n=1 Tax=Sphingopyxis sp. YR583 TaxID=1881047 RepID=UPI0008A7961D|nr:cupin domain-containing protein [Sphingopyxis sp. YR583]SEH13882.1 Predicted enzyme of the cupin superfamily [Sphingopyxis sp. YR583]
MSDKSSEAGGSAEDGTLKVRPIDLAAPIACEAKVAGPGEPFVRGGVHSVHTSEDGAMTVGIWQGTPGTVTLTDYPSDELWYILSGTIEFADKGEGALKFSAGESFLLPRGFSGNASISGEFRKLFAMSPALRR